MRIPKQDSLNTLLSEIMDSDYTDPKGIITKTDIEYNEDDQKCMIDRGVMNKLMRNNYVEPSHRLQDIYESQFRSFSKSNDKLDSFDDII